MLLQCEADGSPNLEAHAVKHKEYHRTHNLDSPSDRHGKQHLDTPHQKACCEQQVASLQLEAQSVSTLWEKQEHRPCHHNNCVRMRAIAMGGMTGENGGVNIYTPRSKNVA